MFSKLSTDAQTKYIRNIKVNITKWVKNEIIPTDLKRCNERTTFFFPPIPKQFFEKLHMNPNWSFKMINEKTRLINETGGMESQKRKKQNENILKFHQNKRAKAYQHDSFIPVLFIVTNDKFFNFATPGANFF